MNVGGQIQTTAKTKQFFGLFNYISKKLITARDTRMKNKIPGISMLTLTLTINMLSLWPHRIAKGQ
jgi:hypothetical protein